MTKELIAIPFQPTGYREDRDHSTRGNESWTAQTRVYQTELACTPSEIKAWQGTRYMFSTGKCGFDIDPLTVPNRDRTMMYIRFVGTVAINNHNMVQEKGCKEANLFLAIWAKSRNTHNGSNELDINALLCKPSYYYQTYKVTVEGANSSILKADPVGKRRNFTREDIIIDIEIFEQIVSTGSASLTVNPKYFLFVPQDSIWTLDDWGLDRPTRKITYVIGLSPARNSTILEFP